MQIVRDHYDDEQATGRLTPPGTMIVSTIWK